MNYWMKTPFLMDEAKGDEAAGGGGGETDAEKAATEAAAAAKARGDDFDEDDDADITGDDEGVSDADKAKAAEEKAAADKAEAEKADAKKAALTIPKARFDEAVKKEREAREAAEKKLEELEAKDAVTDAAANTEKLMKEIEDLEEKYEGLMAEGSPEARKEVRRQIRDKERTLAEAKANARANYATALAVEQVRYDATVERVEGEYEFLNQDSEAFNNEMAGEVLELKGAYEAAGMASSEALKKAVKTLKPQLGELKAALAKAAEGDGVGDAKKDPEAEVKAAEAGAKRRAEAVAKGLKAKDGQPANTAKDAKGGKDPAAKSLDVKAMSDADFDKLSESELAKMRGDNG